MDFAWTEQQQTAYEDVLEATRKAFSDLPPAGAGQHELRQQWRTLGELGVLGLCLPSSHGGRGLGALETAHLVEALGRGCPDTGLVFAASAHLFACGVPIADYGSPRVRAAYLPGMACGDLIAANAMTEEQAGSDVSRLSVTAREVDDGYVLDGVKTFVSNGPVADVLVTYACTDPASGFLGQTAFVVDAHAAGVELSPPFGKMGLDSCRAGSVLFRSVLVPRDAVLGTPGAGSAVFQHSMAWERACLFAGYVGLLDRLVEQCVEHVRTRRQFGQPLARFQAVAHRVVDMKLHLEAARLLLYRACWEMDNGGSARLATALSKLAVSEGAVDAALAAVRLFGGRGYRTDAGIERVLRDTVPTLIFSGTSDVQRELAARELGL